MSKIIAKYFEECTGYEPENDDLERVNCSVAGEDIGHLNCGWCKKDNMPVFLCGCKYRNALIYKDGCTTVRVEYGALSDHDGNAVVTKIGKNLFRSKSVKR